MYLYSQLYPSIVGRPSFSLSDDEAHLLVADVTRISERFPLNPRDHRPFVREFIRSLHRITGKTYSPAIYRRLLAAYAPARKPSSATLSLEKQRFLQEQTVPADPSRPLLARAPTDDAISALMEEVRRLAELTAARPASNADAYLVAQCDFLQHRLSETEKGLNEARALAAQLATELKAAHLQAEHDRAEVTAARTASSEMAVSLAAMAKASDDIRSFALRAIDEVRGETRAWRERCQLVEEQLNEQVLLTETFRRLAYRGGADIPAVLDRKTSP